MRKLVKRVVLCGLAAAMFWCGCVFSDRQRLGKEVDRLHAVANSNTASDQSLKMQIWDDVMDSLQKDIQNIKDVDQAMNYLQEKLPLIQRVAENTLRRLGCEELVTITLAKEAFATSHYDTILLPSGLYNILRIAIGNREGKNFWSVMFPDMCPPGMDTD